MRWRLKRWSHSRVGERLVRFRVTDQDEWVATQRIKQIEVIFSYVCPVIDHEFRHNIVKEDVYPTGDSRVGPDATAYRSYLQLQFNIPYFFQLF